MKLDFDSGKKIHNYVAEYADIYSQFDKDALAKEQLKIDQQKVGMLQQKFATEQADNVTKLKAQGMLADNPNIRIEDLAVIDIGIATKVQALRASQATIKDLGKPKTLTAAQSTLAIDRVLGRNREYLQGTVGKNYLDEKINSYFGDETTGGAFFGWGESSLIPDDLDTSSLDSVLNFFNRNKDKLGLDKGAYKDTRKEIIKGYKQVLSEGARSLAYGDNTTAPATPSGGQERKSTNTNKSVGLASNQASLNPVGTPKQPPSVSQALIRIQAAIDETNTLEELAQLQQTVSENQKAVQVTPQQAAEVNAKFDKKSRELGR